uniref:Uncharacterized protein n=1 Tax=Oryza sativa subsp. japonica TaxID=39947 RepID=Q69KQ2_ORYSJ|nr:hypothetical protein [Oryza sativa Japonica Group]
MELDGRTADEVDLGMADAAAPMAGCGGSSGADGERGKKVERGAVVGYIEVGRPDVAGSGGSAATTWRGRGAATWGRVGAEWGADAEEAAAWAAVSAADGGGCRRLGTTDRWAPPVGAREERGGGRREEPAWAGSAEGRPALEGMGRAQEKGKRREKKR